MCSEGGETVGQKQFATGIFLGILGTVCVITGACGFFWNGQIDIWKKAVKAGVAVKLDDNEYEFKRGVE